MVMRKIWSLDLDLRVIGIEVSVEALWPDELCGRDEQSRTEVWGVRS